MKWSPDPEFQANAERVLSLYRECPPGGVVVCFDEMGPIEPISHQGSGWAPRKLPERLRATYRKHGGVRYLIADNLPAHKAHDIRQWAENNNVKMIFTRPTSAS